MNKKHRGYAEFFIVSFMVCIVFALICTFRWAHKSDLEAVKEHHKQIDSSPVQTIDGQKFHVHDNHLYPIVKVAGEEKTIYN